MDNERGVIKGSSSMIFKKASGHELALLDNDLKSLYPSNGEKISLHILALFPVLPSVKATNMSKHRYHPSLLSLVIGTILAGSYLNLVAASTKHARGLHVSQDLAGVRHHWRHCDPCWIRSKTGTKHSELLFLCGEGMSHTEIEIENGVEKACRDINFEQQIYHSIHISSANHWKVREAGVFLWQATTNVYIYIYTISCFLPNAFFLLKALQSSSWHTISIH